MDTLCEKKKTNQLAKTYLIDSHAHMDMPQFEQDRDEVIQAARKAGLGKILTVALSIAGAQQTLQICRRHPDLFLAALGIHPHDAQKANAKIFKEMTTILSSQSFFVALGEIGLDYYRNLSPQDCQQRIFRQQLRLAKELHLPVIIHCRDAQEDTLSIMKDENISHLGGVMHCFSGDERFAQDCLELNLLLSFAGPLTYKTAGNLRQIVKKIPLNRILVETDCPYLAPEPYRGKRNEPAYVTVVVDKIAEIKNLPRLQVVEQVMNNFYRVFGHKSS